MSRMRVVQVAQPNGPFELVERNIPEPAAGEVRIKVEACGICHSDAFTKEGTFPGIQFPLVPGHEVAEESMPLEQVLWDGAWANASESVGMAETAAIASRAAAASFLPASGVVSQVLHTMAGMPIH